MHPASGSAEWSVAGEAALRLASRAQRAFGPLYEKVSVLAAWGGRGDQQAAAELEQWAEPEDSYLANIKEHADSQAESVGIMARSARDRASGQLGANAEADFGAWGSLVQFGGEPA